MREPACTARRYHKCSADSQDAIVRTVAVWLQAIVPLVVLSTACVRPATAFLCANSDQCTGGGVCQTTGLCSFEDPTCMSGQRYGAASGDLSQLCVDAESGSGSNGGEPPACDPAKPFGTPVLVQGVASMAEDASMRLSPDEKTAYFFSARSGSKLLYTATRAAASATFSNVAVLANVNTSDQYNPVVTSDGLTLFFASYRTTGVGDNDIYQATRTALTADFTDTRLTPNVNSSASEVQPYVTRDGTTMYFVRTAPATGDTVFRALGSVTRGFTNPIPVAELDGPTNDADPVLSSDGLTLFWATDRLGGMGDLDIWQASRPDTASAFGDLVPVSSVNSPAFDSPSDVSVDGCRLYITSIRSGRTAIYVATRAP